MSEPTYQPGWYQIDGELRYHDGEQWTEHTEPITCPKCGSTEIGPVSSWSKAGVLLALGLLAPLGIENAEKKYRCKRCYTRW